MNDHEITELARLLPAPDGRDLPAGRKRILKEHLMTELRSPTGRPHPARPRRRPRPRPRHRPRRRVLLAVGAGLAAGAVAVAAVAGTHPQPRTQPRTQPAAQPGTQPGAKASAAPVTAATLLVRIARAAASQPTPAVR